jgi:hypothetical protein
MLRTAHDSTTLELGEPRFLVARAHLGNRNDTRDRNRSIENQHLFAALDVLEQRRKMIPRLGYCGAFHVAMIAMYRADVNIYPGPATYSG